MATVTVELPADLAGLIEENGQQLATVARHLLAMELFRNRGVSLGRAVELSGMPYADFMDLLADHGIEPFRYTSQDLADDLATLEQMRL